MLVESPSRVLGHGLVWDGEESRVTAVSCQSFRFILVVDETST